MIIIYLPGKYMFQEIKRKTEGEEFMSRYVENNLRTGEEVVLEAKKNPLRLIVALLLPIALLVAGIIMYASLGEGGAFEGEDMEFLSTPLIVLVVIAVLWMLLLILEFCSMTLVLTNKRAIGKAGLFKKRVLDYPIEKINTVGLKSTLFGSIFHYQTVSLTTGSEKALIMFKGISNANQFKNAVTDAVEKHQEEARIKQAEEIARAMRG